MKPVEPLASSAERVGLNTLTAQRSVLGPAQLGRLKWRARRGLLENDLVIARYFARFESTLTEQDVQGLSALLELPDNDLMDLILQRSDLAADAAPQTARVLQLLRTV